MEVYTSFCYISQKSDAFWSLNESHGEAKNGATGEKANFWYSSFWIRLWCLHESCSPRKELSNAWSYASIRQPRQRESAFYEQSWKLRKELDVEESCRHRGIIYSTCVPKRRNRVDWTRDQNVVDVEKKLSTSIRFVEHSRSRDRGEKSEREITCERRILSESIKIYPRRCPYIRCNPSLSSLFILFNLCFIFKLLDIVLDIDIVVLS
jgi:hypothetical protein